MRTFLRGKVTLLFMMLGMLLAIPAIAYADNLVDTLDGDATSDPSASQTISAGDSTSTGFTNNYWIVANGAGTSPAGCDVANAGDSITATFSWPSTGAGSLPAGVTASTNSITFDECKDGSDNNAQSVKFTSNQVGTYTIPAPTKSDGTGTYSTNPSSFTLVVNDNCPGPNGDLSGDLQDGTCAAPVTNHAPTVSNDAGNVSGNEGSQITNSGAFSDADGNGTLTITKLSGAGTVTPSTTTPGAWSWSHTPNDNGSGTVEVRASDGTATVTDSFDWSAANVAPTVTNIAASAQNALSGKDVTFTGTATDVSSVDQAAGFFWKWSEDGGTFGSYGAQAANTFTASFSSCGSHHVSAVAKDKDNGESAAVDSGSVNVYNASYLSPLNEGTYNTVQAGRVVPVKISVGCPSGLTGLSPSIQLLKGEQDGGESTSGTDNVETLSSSAADTAGSMRAIDGGYIYNLQVPSTASCTPSG